MNRELKFRAWDDKNKQWLCKGFSLTGEIVMIGEWTNMFDPFLFNRDGRKLSDLKIMQFTGREDKNGVNIYEGDIVKRNYATWVEDELDEDKEVMKKVTQTSVVEYRDHGFWIKDEEFGWDGEGLWNWDMAEVIGNIFENPELLTETKHD